MTYTLDGITLPNVTREDLNKDAGLFQLALPGSDSDSTITLDLFGASKTITLTGVYVATTSNDYSVTSYGGTLWASLTDSQKVLVNSSMFINVLESFIDGAQATVDFHSDKKAGANIVYGGGTITGTIKVKI